MITVEQGVVLVLELASEIFKAVESRDSMGIALKRVHDVIEAKMAIDHDVDAAARGGK